MNEAPCYVPTQIAGPIVVHRYWISLVACTATSACFAVMLLVQASVRALEQLFEELQQRIAQELAVLPKVSMPAPINGSCVQHVVPVCLCKQVCMHATRSFHSLGMLIAVCCMHVCVAINGCHPPIALGTGPHSSCTSTAAAPAADQQQPASAPARLQHSISGTCSSSKHLGSCSYWRHWSEGCS